MVTPLQHHFNSLFAADEDPWNYRSSWPEKRRFDLLMAMLPHEYYGSVFEPACANATLTERLCARAGRVLAWDGSPEAIARGRRRLAKNTKVQFACKTVPDHWPTTSMDLVVLSDFLYYLSKERVVDVAELASQSIGVAGTIVACHWRESAHDFLMPGGDAVHLLLTESLGTPAISYLDDRHVMDVWTR